MEDRSKGSDVREESNGIMMCVPRRNAAMMTDLPGFGSLWLELAEFELEFRSELLASTSCFFPRARPTKPQLMSKLCLAK